MNGVAAYLAELRDALSRLAAEAPETLWMAALAALCLVLLVALARRSTQLRRAETRMAEMSGDLKRLGETEAALAEARAERDVEGRERAALAAQLIADREASERRVADLLAMKQEIEDRFSALAGGVLKENSEAFLTLVTERFKQHESAAAEDLSKRQQAIEGLVKPLGERLGAFDKRIDEIERARNDAYGAIRQQVRALAEGQQSLSQETRRLVQALRAPKTRGRWGEMQLKRVFELAGMSEHVDFTTEETLETDTGSRRPDAIVRLPGGRSIVVDAKTPLEAYLDALEAEGPDAQTAAMKRHAQHVRAHVKALASKTYQDALPETPDFIVMFIPGETFVSAAVEADPGIIEDAFASRVLIASPTTLMALVKAIAYGWQQERMAENAVEVQRLAKDLYDRLAVFARNLDGVGKSLRAANENYNRSVGSLEGRILPTARKFEQMGVVAAPNLEAPKAVETEPRPLTASEFTD